MQLTKALFFKDDAGSPEDSSKPSALWVINVAVLAQANVCANPYMVVQVIKLT